MNATRPIRVTIDLDENSGREQFIAIALDRCGAKLDEHRILSRFSDRTELNCRKIFGMALRCEASALLVAHTHPSGDPKPSKSDLSATRSLARICADLDIHLADHVILAAGGQFSFRKAGLL
jgi:DNA repair protein RadC